MQGFHAILPTPFHKDESVDLSSLPRVVEYFLADGGVDGVVILGAFGEADVLDDEERDDVVRVAGNVCSARCHFTVAVSHPSPLVAHRRAIRAREAGADAVLIAPFRADSPKGLAEMYASVVAATGLELVVHDYPQFTGTHITIDDLREICRVVPASVSVKLEGMPTVPRIQELKRRVPRCAIFAGSGGKYLVDELLAGADGIMTGMVAARLISDLLALMRDGHTEQARDLFERMAPLFEQERDLRTGVSLRKRFLWSRGVIESPTLRRPRALVDVDVRAFTKNLELIRR
jgi:dihydrodipicolinate synthase/N-acetylneuraminate lyase